MSKQWSPSQEIIKIIDEAGGNIFSSVTAFAAGGVGTARTQIESHAVPDNARTLLGWRPIDTGADLAVSEGLGSIFDISGDNYKFQPQEVPGPVAASILTTGGYAESETEYWDVFAPVAGGEFISIGIEPLDAIVGNRRTAVELWWTEKRIPVPVIYGLSTRETAVSLAGATSGTDLNINFAHTLIECGGLIVTQVMTIEEEISLSLRINSQVLSPNQGIPVLFDQIPAIADLAIDQGPVSAYVSRRRPREKFLAEKATITGVYTLDVALTSAAALAHYVRWV